MIGKHRRQSPVKDGVVSPSAARRERWNAVGTITGIVGVVVTIVCGVPAFAGWQAQAQASEDEAPRISFAISQQHDLYLLDGIYVTNTGGSPVTVSSVEVRSLSYPFYDRSAPSPCGNDAAGKTTCTGAYLPLGVVDYASTWRANNTGGLYMGTTESCGGRATEIPAGGRPAAFGVVLRAPRDPAGKRLVSMASLPRPFKFTVVVTFAGNKLMPETVTFDPATYTSDPAQDAGMADDFAEIARACAPDLLSEDTRFAPKILPGTSYESYLYLAGTDRSAASLVRGPDKRFG